MSISAMVEGVIHNEDESGRLVLSGEYRGQPELAYESAPHDVTALNGMHIWGGDGEIVLGELRIAKRIGYGRIEFVVPSLSKAVGLENRRKEARDTLVKCPSCEGRKRGMVHLNTTSGGHWQEMDCTYCDGLGMVLSASCDKYRDGERMREDRKARKATLREEAERLGISPIELSHREWGRD